jgi:hypothetical protein
MLTKNEELVGELNRAAAVIRHLRVERRALQRRLKKERADAAVVGTAREVLFAAALDQLGRRAEQ